MAKKVKDKHQFFHENLHYFDDNKKLITIEDDIKVNLKVIAIIGGIIFFIGVLLFSITSYTNVSFFFFFFSLLFLIKGLLQYISYIEYKEVPLTLYNKNLKLGKTLRAYVTIDKVMEDKEFIILLTNEYRYERYSTGNDRRKSWIHNRIWSYKTYGYPKVEGKKTYVYFEIPIDKNASASKKIRNASRNLQRKYVWTLTIKNNRKFFPLKRKYTIKIRK